MSAVRHLGQTLSALWRAFFSRNLPRFAHEPPSKWRHAKFSFFIAKEAGCMLLNANILGSADSRNSGRVDPAIKATSDKAEIMTLCTPPTC